MQAAYQAKKTMRSAKIWVDCVLLKMVFLAWSACAPDLSVYQHSPSTLTSARKARAQSHQTWGLASKLLHDLSIVSRNALRKDRKAFYDGITVKADIAAAAGDPAAIHKLTKQVIGFAPKCQRVVRKTNGELTKSTAEYGDRFLEHFCAGCVRCVQDPILESTPDISTRSALR